MENKIPKLPNDEHYCQCGHQRKKHINGSDPKSGFSSHNETGGCEHHLCSCWEFNLAMGGIYGGPEKLT